MMPCHKQGSLTVGWRSPGKDEFYIFRHMTGQDLPLGQSLAEKRQKGVTRAILAQGWYFFNKLMTHSAEVSEVTEMGTNQICILCLNQGVFIHLHTRSCRALSLLKNTLSMRSSLAQAPYRYHRSGRQRPDAWLVCTCHAC